MAGGDVIRAFIVEKFLFGDGANFQDEDSLLGKGIIDSTGILSLIAFIEQQFSVRFEDQEIIPDNLDSVNKINAFIEHKQNRLVSAQNASDAYAAFGG